MKKRLAFTFLSCSILFSIQAQKPPVKFGDVSLNDMKMTRYAADSSATAVVLVDFGETVITYNQNTGFEMNFTRVKRTKILTKEGLDEADFAIDLYHSSNSGDKEKISALKAVTYNLENGKIVEYKVKDNGIMTEKVDDNWDRMKITWPNVKEGSIIEITYNINSDFFSNLQDWQFQETIPVVWSEYRTRIPEYFKYDKYMQGYIPLTVNEETQMPKTITLSSIERSGDRVVTSTINNEAIHYTENRFRWVAQDVPGFKAEPFITTVNDYISEINFELSSTKFPNSPMKNYMGSWEDINKTFAEDEDFGLQVTGNGFLKKTVEEITAGLAAPDDKIKAIDAYVKRNILWNEVTRKYVSSSLKKVVEEKKGNSADINFLLASMLEKAGFTVFPVLLSTRNHGFLRESIPVSSQFNYVICEVRLGDKTILLDATEKLLPTGVLPERCLNGKGLSISKEGYKWIDLQTPVKSRTLLNSDLALDVNGELKGKMQIDRSGYHGLKCRRNYFSKGETDYVKDFAGTRSSWEFEKSEFKGATEIQNPFSEIHTLTITDHVSSSGDIMYINPFVIGKQEENPFKLEKREYPVDFGSAFDNMYIVKIKIPEGYSVEELPKSKVFMLPASAAKYVYNMTNVSNTITLTSNLSINKNLFSQDEYLNLREFYNQVVAKQAEQIVLKKNP